MVSIWFGDVFQALESAAEWDNEIDLAGCRIFSSSLPISKILQILLFNDNFIRKAEEESWQLATEVRLGETKLKRNYANHP